MSVLWSRITTSGRVLCASALLVPLALLLFTINAIHPVLPWFVLWAPSTIGSALMVAKFWRTARAEHLPEPTRRFWRHLLAVASLVSLGSLAQAHGIVTAADPAGQHISAGQMVFDGLAIGLIIYSLLRLPFGRQSGGELFRIVLDAGTVMLACAVFAWHFSTRYALHGGDEKIIYISLALTTLALLAVFAVAKVMMTRPSAFLDRGALRRIGIAVLIGAVGPTLRPLLESVDPHLYPDMVGMPLIFFF